MKLAKRYRGNQTRRSLIGLGSVGIELHRLDQYSDLDFFVIVRAGSKSRYLNDLGWLTEIAPVAYSFANTADGYKLLYQDGVFCEFAVFEEDELKEAVFSPGRVVWKAEGVSEKIGVPQRAPAPETTVFDRVAGWRSAHEPVCWPGQGQAWRKIIGDAVHPKLCG